LSPDSKLRVTNITSTFFNQSTFTGKLVVYIDNVRLTLPYQYASESFTWEKDVLTEELNKKWGEIFINIREEIGIIVLQEFSITPEEIVNFTSGLLYFFYPYLKDHISPKRLKCSFENNKWIVIEG
jgi:hypothetical protein